MTGFAINCGVEDRIIILDNDIYTIGCFKGTYAETVEAINSKYTGQDALDYIQKLDDCKSVDERLHIYKDDEDDRVRYTVAKYSDKYHDQFKDDAHWFIRQVVAEYSDKYHDQLKDDVECEVRLSVANYSK